MEFDYMEYSDAFSETLVDLADTSSRGRDAYIRGFAVGALWYFDSLSLSRLAGVVDAVDAMGLPEILA
jgi:hypothetical protein